MVASHTNALIKGSPRAFRGTPDLHDYVPLESIEQEIRPLLDSVVRGDGIVVLTAAPGAGKTVVCRHLQAELAGQFEAVVLSSSEFATRRSLLQAILFELGGAYEGLTEQELRLAILSHVRRTSSDRWGVVLIVDEAHLLNPRLLEELRCLTNHADDGKSLIRVVLCAQLALEELLTQPSLQALNYRITCHATIEPLSMRDSAELVAGRLRHVGRQVGSVFTPEALETICRVSDGNPRCLVQLCDHSLTLAEEADDAPISVDVVRRALKDLKQLPLQWNESIVDQPIDRETAAHSDVAGGDATHLELPPSSTNTDSQSSAEFALTEMLDDVKEWTNDVPSVEVGADDANLSASESPAPPESWNSFETSLESESPCPLEATSSQRPAVSPMALTDCATSDERLATPAESPVTVSEPFVEVSVDDRYAALDEQSGHAIELPRTSDVLVAPRGRTAREVKVVDTSAESSPDLNSASSPANTRLPVAQECEVSARPAAGQLLLQELSAPDEPYASRHEDWHDEPIGVFDVVEPHWLEEAVLDDVPIPHCQPAIEAVDATGGVSREAPLAPPRPYARLFSRLRRERA